MRVYGQWACVLLLTGLNACQPQAAQPVQTRTAPMPEAPAISDTARPGPVASPRPTPTTAPAATGRSPTLVEQPIPTASPTPTQPAHTGSAAGSSSGGSSGSGGSGGPPASSAPANPPTPTPTPLPIPTPTAPPDGVPVIHDLRLPDGPSVLGNSAPGALRADYTGGQISLQAIGYFFDPLAQDVSLRLNNSLDFSLQEASNYVLHFGLDTGQIPDLYLEGPHWIRLQVGSTVIEDQLRVGAAITPAHLYPALLSAALVSSTDGQTVLEVVGTHLMRNPRFAQARINDQVVPVLQVWPTAQQNQALMHVRLPDNFTASGSHDLTYSSPFGTAFYRFEGSTP